MKPIMEKCVLTDLPVLNDGPFEALEIETEQGKR